MKKKDKCFWLATIDSIPCNSFETRKEAIKWLKGMLKQVSRDFKKQDKHDEYDYDVELRKGLGHPSKYRVIAKGSNKAIALKKARAYMKRENKC